MPARSRRAVAAVEDAEAAPDADLQVLDPVEVPLVLPVSGLDVLVQPLRTRQLFRLLKILTRGAGGFLSTMPLDAEDGMEQFVQQMLTLVVLSIPEAEQETIDFLRTMVHPADYVHTNKPSKEQRAANEAALEELYTALDNPEIEDTLAIIETIIRNESKNLQSLGKRLMGMMRMAQATGQTAKKAVS